ncbi:hypothetical protein GCM10009594_15120 [Kocuria palustris]|uniref:hypothetical protein n=1 Tax=Kocuria palustris TaxID=71999 RepID=UPI00195B039B|nr:hypothetical protein [Kocuria palustris]MBM7821920.1 hypothetical protein [Kocuria palustris]
MLGAILVPAAVSVRQIGVSTELLFVLVDDLNDQRGGRSSSAAKKAEADFRIGGFKR